MNARPTGPPQVVQHGPIDRRYGRPATAADQRAATVARIRRRMAWPSPSVVYRLADVDVVSTTA